MEQIKHECGIAMVRLLKPLLYYKEKYGSNCYGLSKLYLLMEKQHNRGQEGAGIGVVKLHSEPGKEYVFRERALGSGAIQEVFDNIRPQLEKANAENVSPEIAERDVPFVGEIYMGHLRYSTTGRSGISYVHPFLRRNNWRSRNLLLCGNFNMTNVENIFREIIESGQHPRTYSDTVILLEQVGYALDKENHRRYRDLRDIYSGNVLTRKIEDSIDIKQVLASTSPSWDGGYVICGATGSGDMFALRDPHGIRPAFYYADDEIVVVASERPVIQTTLDVHSADVVELKPGEAIIVKRNNDMEIAQIQEPASDARCSFERIYFSRGSDKDIYRERKELGRLLVPDILSAVDNDLSHSIFSFIPNTAEVAFIGMIEGLESYFDALKERRIMECKHDGTLTNGVLHEIMSQKLRVEKIVIKDIKLRTFIAEGESRNDLATHVYDVTYGQVAKGEDSIVVIDDSIVRGTTLRQSIIRMLDRLNPRKIVIVSSSPQVRYPDCYGIDMSRMAEFAAFRAAVELLKESGQQKVLEDTYNKCLRLEDVPDDELYNCVKDIYNSFSERQIAEKMAQMLTPSGTKAKIEIIFQSVENLHKAVPSSPGDWYFSGNYPTPGGIRLVNRAYINFYEGNTDKR